MAAPTPLFSGHKASTSSIDAPLLAAAEEHAFELCSLAKGGVSTRRKQQTETSPEVNWAANVHYSAKDVREPATIRELQKIIASAQDGIRMLGSRHSFSRVADCRGELISASRLAASAGPIKIDARRHTATCSAGITYAELAAVLQAAGYALHNLASLPHISVVGAMATATHGSGIQNGNLTTALISCEYIDASGAKRVARDRSKNNFAADDGRSNTLQAVLLGALGCITSVTLAIEPTYEVRQDVYLDLPWAILMESSSLNTLFSEAYSVSVFIDDYAHPNGASQLWIKRRVPGASILEQEPGSPTAKRSVSPPGALKPAVPLLFGARLAGRRVFDRTGRSPPSFEVKQMHPIASMAADDCTHQGEPSGPWNERLPHFHAEGEPSSRGNELQSEYFVAREDAPRAIAALRSIGTKLKSVLQVSELRAVAADAFWLSPCYNRDSIGLHFTWTHDEAYIVREVLPLVEKTLKPFNARPHWGKLFTMPPSEVAPLYPMLSEYRELILQLDPNGVFRNEFIERYIMAPHVHKTEDGEFGVASLCSRTYPFEF